MDSVTAFRLIIQEVPLLLGLLAILFVVGVSFYRRFLYISIIVFIALLFLFRNPTRINTVALSDPYALIAPADGKIVGISYNRTGNQDGYYYVVSIATSLMDVQGHRVVSAGDVVSVHRAINGCEYCDVIVMSKYGSYKMRQMAGIIARKIVCWPKVGDVLKVGQLYGMGLFGARFELYLPKKVRLSVGVGQHVQAGLTTLGHWVH